MPWNINDVKHHKKGLSKKESRKWVAIANNVLKDKGEIAAIKIANSQTKRIGENTDEIINEFLSDSISAIKCDRLLKKMEKEIKIMHNSNKDNHEKQKLLMKILYKYRSMTKDPKCIKDINFYISDNK